MIVQRNVNCETDAGDSVRKILAGFAAASRLFYSEADLQHQLAWSLHDLPNVTDVRLEYPWSFREHTCPISPPCNVPTMRENLRGGHVDIWVELSKSIWVIELKYKTQALLWGQYRLKDQSAQDTGRYDFVKMCIVWSRLLKEGMTLLDSRCF